MAEYVLYTDGSNDCIEAHRLLLRAGVSHLVLFKEKPDWSVPSVKRGFNQNLIGLNVIRQYLQSEHGLIEIPATPDQPTSPPPHDDKAYARIASAASQGRSI